MTENRHAQINFLLTESLRYLGTFSNTELLSSVQDPVFSVVKYYYLSNPHENEAKYVHDISYFIMTSYRNCQDNCLS